MKLNPGLLFLLTLGLQSSSVFADNAVIPVVDATANSQAGSYPTVVASPAANVSNRSVSRGNSSLAELLYQLDLLQQEVQQLRGIVEQQSWQIKQMGAEQRDRYIDLDRRITLLSHPGAQGDEPVTGKSSTSSPTNIAGGGQVSSDKVAYQAAFNLIRNKRYDEAVVALQQFIRKYPGSPLLGNAHYWLGEVHLVKVNFQDALTAFNALLTEYPDHRKVPDAKYKLGRVYRELGDAARAKQLLQEVVKRYAGTSAAKLAKAELRNNQF